MVLDEPKKEEKTTDINGISLLIAEHILPFTQGQKIDYIESPQGEGFAILPTGCN